LKCKPKRSAHIYAKSPREQQNIDWLIITQPTPRNPESGCKATKIYTRKKQEKNKIQKEVHICCWRSPKVGDQPVLLLGDGTVGTKKPNSGVCKIIFNQEILLL
jgi:hypothetical protein